MKLRYVSPKVEYIEFGSKDVLTPSDPGCLGDCPEYECPSYEEGIGCKYNQAWCPND